jgi:DNA end-binding protein Ku
MAPTLWKGALAFGLVNIPVELRSAVRSAEKLSFRQLERKTLQPIKQERVSAVSGETVPWSEIVKGYEITKGKFIVMSDEDFEKVSPEMARTLEMTDFVPADSVDTRFYDQPYYLVPQKGGEKAYALLRDALAETGKVGIGTFALRQKQHLAAVKAVGDALVLEMMRFEAELVDPAELSFPDSEKVHVRPQERQMAVQLIENLSQPFDPSKYKDEYTERLRAIIKAKAKGKKIATPDTAARESTDVVDLVSRLQESLAASSGGRKGAAKKHARSSSSRAAAKKRRSA